MSDRNRVWALVPAAGLGQRFGAALPKQYQLLAGDAVLWHSLSRLCRHPQVAGVWVGLAAGDTYWPALGFSHPRLAGVYPGGTQRAATVLNGLRALHDAGIGDEAWVLVHDAARPCVRATDITRLIAHACKHDVAALLGVPVADTLKRAGSDGQIMATVDRADLWLAQTPQIARLGKLAQALCVAQVAGIEVSDEASALERLGGRSRLVAGSADNIKITVATDLPLAEHILQAQRIEGAR